MKTEALKLADELEGGGEFDWGLATICVSPNQTMKDSATMIRRLVEELDKQGEPVAWWNGKSRFCSPRDKSWDAKTGGILSFGCDIPLYTAPQTKPLSDEEITQVFDKCYPNNGDGDVVTLVDFARAIEERHGIK